MTRCQWQLEANIFVSFCLRPSNDSNDNGKTLLLDTYPLILRLYIGALGPADRMNQFNEYIASQPFSRVQKSYSFKQ